MKTAEQNLLNLLIELKNNFGAESLKLEFEAEGTSLEEAIFLNELSQKSGLALTIKIGGCEAIRDICDTKNLNAKTILAPMIESPYAVEKFITALNKIYSPENLKQLKTLINIETITGINALENIINSKAFAQIDGIVVGRNDLINSMKKDISYINSTEILEITNFVSKQMEKMGKLFIVGGKICPDSITFLQNISYLTNFETRKIVFNSDILKQKNSETAIKKAIEFEIEWLKFKQKNFNNKFHPDNERLNNLISLM